MVSTELDKTDGVDVEDVPSAAWGWSKENHKWIQIGGILSALFILAMLHGNHVREGRGHLPDRVRRGDPRHRRTRLVAAPSRLEPVVRSQVAAANGSAAPTGVSSPVMPAAARISLNASSIASVASCGSSSVWSSVITEMASWST